VTDKDIAEVEEKLPKMSPFVLHLVTEALLAEIKQQRKENEKSCEEIKQDDPDGGEHCMRCKQLYTTVYRVPDNIWEEISGRRDGGGSLCPTCADRIAAEFGFSLYWEAGEDEFPGEEGIKDRFAWMREWLLAYDKAQDTEMCETIMGWVLSQPMQARG